MVRWDNDKILKFDVAIEFALTYRWAYLQPYIAYIYLLSNYILTIYLTRPPGAVALGWLRSSRVPLLRGEGACDLSTNLYKIYVVVLYLSQDK